MAILTGDRPSGGLVVAVNAVEHDVGQLVESTVGDRGTAEASGLHTTELGGIGSGAVRTVQADIVQRTVAISGGHEEAVTLGEGAEIELERTANGPTPNVRRGVEVVKGVGVARLVSGTRDLGGAPSLLDAERTDDVGSLRTSALSGRQIVGVVVVDVDEALVFNREAGRETVAELRRIGKQVHLALGHRVGGRQHVVQLRIEDRGRVTSGQASELDERAVKLDAGAAIRVAPAVEVHAHADIRTQGAVFGLGAGINGGKATNARAVAVATVVLDQRAGLVADEGIEGAGGVDVRVKTDITTDLEAGVGAGM